MPQQINLEPTLWSQTRMRGFAEGRSATAIITEALTEWYERHPGPEPKASRASVAIEPPVAASPPDGGVLMTPEIEAALKEVVDNGRLPWDPEKTHEIAAAAVIVPRIIKTPEEAAKMVSETGVTREFHPVPKPGAAKKTRTR